MSTLVRLQYRPVFPQASAYGKCVQASTAPGGRLRKDLCVREFEALRSCFAAAVGGRVPAAPPPSGLAFPLQGEAEHPFSVNQFQEGSEDGWKAIC